jgi:hypothetical protein
MKDSELRNTTTQEGPITIVTNSDNKPLSYNFKSSGRSASERRQKKLQTA